MTTTEMMNTRVWNLVRRGLSTLGKQLAVGVIVAGALAGQAYAGQAPLLIRGATIFNAQGDKPFQSDVLIRDGRIAAIGRTLAAPDAKVIEAEGLALLPGLIDVHVHWTDEHADGRAATAAALLQHGVTTVTDFNAAPESYAPKRQFQKEITSPHVLYVARMGTPGGHGADWGDEHMTATVVGAKDAGETVKRLAPYKPDAIKAFTDGWRYGSGIDNNSMNEDAVAAIAQEAGHMGVPLLTHTVTVAGARIAVRAHVTTIAHAIQDGPVDADLVSLFKTNKVHYAPTLAVYEPKPKNLAAMSAKMREKVMQRQAFSQQNLQTLAHSGVAIALGTDSGIGATKFGESTLRELELMVNFGLSPAEALTAATAGSASALLLSGDKGTIAVGKRADIILVRGKPWERISDIRNIDDVLVDGAPVVAEGRLVSSYDPKRETVEKAGALIDDFEASDVVSVSGAARLRETDTGFPRSVMLIETEPEGKVGRALHIAAEMALRDKARAFAVLPLSLGSFTPKDASAFEGLRFLARGEGDYQVQIETDDGTFTAAFPAGPEWGLKEIAFQDFTSAKGPMGTAVGKVYAVKIGGARKAGERFWLEVDDMGFY